MITPTLDDVLDGTAFSISPRQTAGRSSEEATAARRLRVLVLYSSGLTCQVYEYVESLGFSRHTAADDLKWARAEWRELHDSPDTAQEIIERHTAKYYDYASRAEQAGDLKLAKEMLQAIEKLRGFHQANTLIQVSNAVTTPTVVAPNLNPDHYTLDELKTLHHLLAKNEPQVVDGAV